MSSRAIVRVLSRRPCDRNARRVSYALARVARSIVTWSTRSARTRLRSASVASFHAASPSASTPSASTRDTQCARRWSTSAISASNLSRTSPSPRASRSPLTNRACCTSRRRCSSPSRCSRRSARAPVASAMCAGTTMLRSTRRMRSSTARSAPSALTLSLPHPPFTTGCWHRYVRARPDAAPALLMRPPQLLITGGWSAGSVRCYASAATWRREDADNVVLLGARHAVHRCGRLARSRRRPP